VRYLQLHCLWHKVEYQSCTVNKLLQEVYSQVINALKDNHAIIQSLLNRAYQTFAGL